MILFFLLLRDPCRREQQDRFQTMSDKIVGRIDEMGSRIDELEKSLGDLMAQVCFVSFCFIIILRSAIFFFFLSSSMSMSVYLSA